MGPAARVGTASPWESHSETIVVTSSPRLASALQTQVAAVLPEMDEYRIARNVDGRARRHPVGTPHAGEVEVEFGPRNQVGADEIASLERTKALLLAVQPMFDFDVLVW